MKKNNFNPVDLVTVIGLGLTAQYLLKINDKPTTCRRQSDEAIKFDSIFIAASAYKMSKN